MKNKRLFIFWNFEKNKKTRISFGAFYLCIICVWELCPGLRLITSTQVRRQGRRFASRSKIDNGIWIWWRRSLILIALPKARKSEKKTTIIHFLNFEKNKKTWISFSAFYLCIICEWELCPVLRLITSTQVRRQGRRFASRSKINNGIWILIALAKARKSEKKQRLSIFWNFEKK